LKSAFNNYNCVKGAIGYLTTLPVSAYCCAIAPIFAEIGGLINVLMQDFSEAANKISQDAWNIISQYISGAPTEIFVNTLINNACGTEMIQ
jgi:hypothetical protein